MVVTNILGASSRDHRGKTQPGGAVRQLIVTVALLLASATILPPEAPAQEKEFQVVDHHQDWRVIRYEDPFGEHSGSVALNGPLEQTCPTHDSWQCATTTGQSEFR